MQMPFGFFLRSQKLPLVMDRASEASFASASREPKAFKKKIYWNNAIYICVIYYDTLRPNNKLICVIYYCILNFNQL
jgi:hypothetical protein